MTLDSATLFQTYLATGARGETAVRDMIHRLDPGAVVSILGATYQDQRTYLGERDEWWKLHLPDFDVITSDRRSFMIEVKTVAEQNMSSGNFTVDVRDCGIYAMIAEKLGRQILIASPVPGVDTFVLLYPHEVKEISHMKLMGRDEPFYLISYQHPRLMKAEEIFRKIDL